MSQVGAAEGETAPLGEGRDPRPSDEAGGLPQCGGTWHNHSRGQMSLGSTPQVQSRESHITRGVRRTRRSAQTLRRPEGLETQTLRGLTGLSRLLRVAFRASFRASCTVSTCPGVPRLPLSGFSASSLQVSPHIVPPQTHRGSLSSLLALIRGLPTPHLLEPGGQSLCVSSQSGGVDLCVPTEHPPISERNPGVCSTFAQGPELGHMLESPGELLKLLPPTPPPGIPSGLCGSRALSREPHGHTKQKLLHQQCLANTVFAD